jgi:hypothetical protein
VSKKLPASDATSSGLRRFPVLQDCAVQFEEKPTKLSNVCVILLRETDLDAQMVPLIEQGLKPRTYGDWLSDHAHSTTYAIIERARRRPSVPPLHPSIKLPKLDLTTFAPALRNYDCRLVVFGVELM